RSMVRQARANLRSSVDAFLAAKPPGSDFAYADKITPEGRKAIYQEAEDYLKNIETLVFSKDYGWLGTQAAIGDSMTANDVTRIKLKHENVRMMAALSQHNALGNLKESVFTNPANLSAFNAEMANLKAADLLTTGRPVKETEKELIDLGINDPAERGGAMKHQ